MSAMLSSGNSKGNRRVTSTSRPSLTVRQNLPVALIDGIMAQAEALGLKNNMAEIDP